MTFDLELINRHRPFFEAVAAAHTEAALRDNLSSVIIRSVSGAGAEPIRSVLAGIMSLETLHGPVALARQQLLQRSSSTWWNLKTPGIQYGYGSSFVKGKPDPLLAKCEEVLFKEYDTMSPEFAWLGKIPPITYGGRLDTPLYPNMAFYSAILAELIRWPAGLEFLLVAALRAGAWATLLKK